MFELRGNVAETGPLSTVGDTVANTQKKTWEMMVNPDVDCYTNPTSPENTQKNAKKSPTENHKNTKTE